MRLQMILQCVEHNSCSHSRASQHNVVLSDLTLALYFAYLAVSQFWRGGLQKVSWGLVVLCVTGL